jgi:hypothetical protein
MKQHPDAQHLAPDRSSTTDPFRPPAASLLGWYTTAEGLRHLRAVVTAEQGLCVIDEAAADAVLVEPRLEGMAEARALAADYLALASERGEPQSRQPWPLDGRSPERGES